jgi:hypothetical protein
VALRVITDTDGSTWEVWEVYTTLAERRGSVERRARMRGDADRRVRVERRPVVAPELRQGWLAFQSLLERRRRAPIPQDWESLPEGDLLALLKGARPNTWPRRTNE